MKIEATPRGFPVGYFRDAYDKECMIQESSAIGDYEDSFDNPGSSFLWLGIEKVHTRVMAKDAAKLGIATEETTGWIDYPIPAEVSLNARMHLNREQVKELVETRVDVTCRKCKRVIEPNLPHAEAIRRARKGNFYLVEPSDELNKREGRV